MFVSCPAARFHATSRTMCIYVYLCVCLHVRDMYAICMRQRGHFQAARHFQALHACGSVSTFSPSRTTCMRQRGRFHSFTLKAARRHLGMSAATVCRTARAFEFVGVRCASRCVSRCASRCVNFSQPHALTRPRARWRWWRWFFSLCSSRFAAQTLEALLGGGLEGHRPRARAPGDPGHARTSLRQVHRDLSTSTSRRRGGPGDGTDRSLAGGRALLQGSTARHHAAGPAGAGGTVRRARGASTASCVAPAAGQWQPRGRSARVNGHVAGRCVLSERAREKARILREGEERRRGQERVCYSTSAGTHLRTR